jgi:hypothetical protein
VIDGLLGILKQASEGCDEMRREEARKKGGTHAVFVFPTYIISLTPDRYHGTISFHIEIQALSQTRRVTSSQNVNAVPPDGDAETRIA